LAPRCSLTAAIRALGTALVWSGLLLVTTPARAQTGPTIELAWQAPAGCPQQSDVRDRIQKLAGSPRPTDNRLSAEGVISQTDEGHFRLELVVRAGGLVGARSIDSKSCKDLAGAAAITLALLLRSPDPFSDGDLNGLGTSKSETGSAGSDGSAPPAPTQPPTPPTPPTARRAEVSPTLADSSSRWHIRLQAPLFVLSAGATPHPSYGFAFGAGVSSDTWRFSLVAAEWLRQSLTAERFPGYGAELDHQSASLALCRAFRSQRFEVAPCLTATLQRVVARGFGNHISPRSESTAWLAPGAGAQGRLYLASWFSLLAVINGEIEASRPQISIDGIGNIGQLGPAAFTVTVGSEWIL